MQTVLDRWKKDYRTIYELVFDNPRIPASDIEKAIGRTGSKRFKKALELQIIVGPHLRKRSYKNLREYMYFLNCKNPVDKFLNFCEDMNVTYHAKATGFCNLWVISRKKIDFDEQIIAEGFCSDYHVSFAPDRTWSTAIQIMQEKVENFDYEDYIPQGIIKTRWGKTIEWDEKDEMLYRYFKYNMRKSLGPAMKEYGISKEEFYDFFNKLPEACTIATGYFPDTLSGYDPFLYMFETDYEDFLINLFSELPTTSFFFKVSDKLFVYVHVPKQLVRSPDLKASIKRLYIPLLINDLLKRGIIREQAESNIDYSWGKDL